MTKKKPLYEQGERVFHLSTLSFGDVTEAFEDTGRGYRYYVRIKGSTWSVPEWALESETGGKRFQEEHGLTKGKNPRSLKAGVSNDE